jgi:mRNA-degrading endonuclease RelE of RelBE toxin-antitoxin system
VPSEYEIFYADKQVEKQLRDLPSVAFKKIDRELMKLKENPRSAKVRKIRGKEGATN